MDTLLILVAAISLVLLLFKWSASGSWKMLFKLLPWIVILSDLPRKYLVVSGVQFLYLTKDIAVLAIYFGILSSSSAFTSLKTLVRQVYFRRLWAAFLLLLGAYIITSLLSRQNIILSLISIRNYLFYMPLALVVPLAFPLDDGGQRFFRYLQGLLVSVVPMLALSMAQFLLPIGHWLNQTYETDAVLGYLTTSRATGSFAYITGLSTYCVFMFPLALAFFLFRPSSKTLIAPVLLLILTTTTLSRLPLYINITVLLASILVISSRYQRRFGKLLIYFFTVAAVVSALLILGFGDTIFVTSGILVDRIQSNFDVSQRLYYTYISQIIDFTGRVGLFWGYGPGFLSNFTNAIADFLSLPVASLDFSYGFSSASRIEAELGKVLLEVGIVFFWLFYGLRIYLCVYGITCKFSSGNAFLELFCRIQAISGLLNATMWQLVYNHTNLYFFWFQIGSIGFCVLADRISSNQRKLLLCQQPPSDCLPAVQS